MKIAFVNDTFLEGRGADTTIYEIAKRLGKKHDIYVIASDSEGFKEENFKIIKINTKKLYTGTIGDYNYPLKIIKFRKEILKLQKKYNFDLFNIHHSSLNPAFLGLPSVVTWYGSPKTKNKLRELLNKTLLFTLKSKKATIVISEYLKKSLENNIGKVKTEIITLGVSKDFKPLKKDKNYMLFVGRCEPHKGIDDLIRISKETNFPLFIVGSGPLLEKLKKYSQSIDAKKVKFSGLIDRKKLVKLYQECSFFISGSKWEGFGLIFLEAAACKKPSIAYNISAMPEVILNGKTGFLAENYSDLKKMAQEMINNKKRRMKMGENAFNFSKKFSWELVSEKYGDFLNKEFSKIK